MNYDYVIRFENLSKDSNVLLQYLQTNDAKSDRIFFNPKSSSKVNSNETSNAFSNVDEERIKILQNIYEKDFNIMGYPVN